MKGNMPQKAIYFIITWDMWISAFDIKFFIDVFCKTTFDLSTP